MTYRHGESSFVQFTQLYAVHSAGDLCTNNLSKVLAAWICAVGDRLKIYARPQNAKHVNSLY